MNTYHSTRLNFTHHDSIAVFEVGAFECMIVRGSGDTHDKRVRVLTATGNVPVRELLDAER